MVTRDDEYRLVSIDTTALTDAERTRVGAATVSRLCWLDGNGNGMARILLPSCRSADVRACVLSLHSDWQQDMDAQDHRYGHTVSCTPARAVCLTAAPVQEVAYMAGRDPLLGEVAQQGILVADWPTPSVSVQRQ